MYKNVNKNKILKNLKLIKNISKSTIKLKPKLY